MTASTYTRSLFHTIVTQVKTALDADVALIGEYIDTPPPHARTLACFAQDRWLQNFSYELAVDPAGTVRTQGFCIIPAERRREFPSAHFLNDEKIEAYVGINLQDRSGKSFGLLAAMFRTPMKDTAHVERVLRDVAAKLAGQPDEVERELERERLRAAARYQRDLYQEYVLDNPEGISLSEIMPPIPVDLPIDEQLERCIYTTHVVEGNRAIARMYGYPDVESFIGATPMDANGPGRVHRVVRTWIDNGYRLINREYQSVDAEGQVTWVQGNAIGIVVDGKLTYLWTKRSDITARKRYEASIEHKAHHDALTGLPNRYWYQQRIEGLIEQHRASGKPFCMMMLDLNRFKEINDTLGHYVGDLVLQSISVRLLKGLRLVDAELARLGGDEFAILVPELADRAQGDRIAETTLQLLGEPMEIQDMRLQIGGSIGISIFPGWSETADDLMRLVDVAMYAAKQEGSGYRWYHPDLDKHSKRRLALLTSLAPAIQQKQLLLAFQPKVAIGDGRVRGFEALARWNHPEQGLIMPTDFIPLAETSEVIRPLTRWVLSAAIEQAATWRRAGLSTPVSANLSARNLMEDDLVEFISATLRRFDLPPSLLELEVTESALMVRPEQSVEILRALHAMGISLAIDDFGTGYSGLAYLTRLPVDTLKIDRSFVLAMMKSKADDQIVRSVVRLAHEFELSVVAEGVEDKQTLDALHAMNCEMAQGFHFAHPMAGDAVVKWIETTGAVLDPGPQRR